MFKRTAADARWSVLICLFVLALITAVIVVPKQFGTQAAGNSKGLVERTSVHDDGLPKMWDIREESGEASSNALARFRSLAGKDASYVAGIRERFVRGEEAFRQRHPDSKIEYNTDIRIPEVFTPNVYSKRIT